MPLLVPNVELIGVGYVVNTLAKAGLLARHGISDPQQLDYVVIHSK
jgi:hypothetical protein